MCAKSRSSPEAHGEGRPVAPFPLGSCASCIPPPQQPRIPAKPWGLWEGAEAPRTPST